MNSLSSSPSQKSRCRDKQGEGRRLWNRSDCGHRQTVCNRERVERGDVCLGNTRVGPAVSLPEIRGQRAEVGAVDGRGKLKVPLVPVRVALTEVGGEDAEVTAVDDAVEIGVAQQRVFQFDLSAAQ